MTETNHDRVPDLGELRAQAAGWQPGFSGGPGNRDQRSYRQTTSPGQLTLRPFGLRAGQKVLYIAGFFGDWAAALEVAGCRVTYTDLSESFLEVADPRRFSAAMTADYVDLPTVPGEYDWTFSYEPVGGTSGGLAVALLRALLNTQGAVLVYYGDDHPGKRARFPQLFGGIASTYGAEYSCDAVRLPATLPDGRPADLPFTISRLQTNDRARSRAYEDLLYLDAFTPRDPGRNTIAVAEIPRAGRDRLNCVAALLAPRFRLRPDGRGMPRSGVPTPS